MLQMEGERDADFLERVNAQFAQSSQPMLQMEGERDADFLERVKATNRRLKKENYYLEIRIVDKAKDAHRHDYNAWNDAERQIRASDNSLMETATVMAMHPTDWPMRLWEQDVDDYTPPSDIDSEDTEELKDMLNDLKELSAEADSIQVADSTKLAKRHFQKCARRTRKKLKQQARPVQLVALLTTITPKVARVRAPQHIGFPSRP